MAEKRAHRKVLNPTVQNSKWLMWLHPHKTQRESCESNNTKQCESCKSKNADTMWIMGYPKTQNITWNLWIQKHKHSVNHVDPKQKKIKVNHINPKTQNIMWIMWIQKHKKKQSESYKSKNTKYNVNHVNPKAQNTMWIMWIQKHKTQCESCESDGSKKREICERNSTNHSVNYVN